MGQTPRLEPGPDHARKAETLRTAARRLEPGDRDLANLLRVIATASEHVHDATVISLDEAWRWTPVVVTALRIANKIEDGVER